jgi:hypothetical protein
MKFFAVKDEHEVCFAVKQVTSDLIQVVDGVEQLFSNLTDHVEIDEFDEDLIGKKLIDGVWTSPGQDAQGNDYFWFEGVLYGNTYDDDGNITGTIEITE